MRVPKKIEFPHLGRMLGAFYKTRHVNKAALARVLQKARPTVHKYHKRSTLQCKLLWDISVALQHNFFADLAAQLPKDYTTHAPDSTAPLQERIAILEEENKLLASKLEELRAAVRKS